MTTYQAPPRIYSLDEGSERELLDSFLDENRSTLLMKCDGLTIEQLRLRPIPGSTMSLLGFVRHMTLVEQWWFERIFEGNAEPLFYSSEEDPDFEWNSLDSGLQATFDLFSSITQRINVAVCSRSLDDRSIGIDSDGGLRTLRWIYIHMIEEYARHNGHADVIREMIDGVTGF